ncbi:MAG TPA: hypothetical protein DD827_10705 [Gammaproteobacteria bacterium]|nr:hypothetical protein [Gammaproteobacteria bacterium]
MELIRFSSGAEQIPSAPTFLALASNPDIASFAGGVPDPQLFPVEQLRKASESIFSTLDTSTQALQYAPSQGFLPLRQWISDDLLDRRILCPSENILITNGAQQALDLISKLLIDANDKIAVTSPTFFAALDTFSVYGPEVLEVPFMRGTLDMSIAEDVLRQRPKFFYIVPDFQNPTGLSITTKQRLELAELCEKYDVPILEDAAYDRLSFDGAIGKPFAAKNGTLDSENVIYINTFSKTISPGLRVGWIAGSSRIVSKLKALKLSSDVHTSVLNQMLVYGIVQNDFQNNIHKAREIYSKRCTILLEALEDQMLKGSWWSRPTGGLFLWLELPRSVDTTKLLPEALEVSKFAFVPGNLSCPGAGCENACRLSFASIPHDKIHPAISRFAHLVKAKNC